MVALSSWTIDFRSLSDFGSLYYGPELFLEPRKRVGDALGAQDLGLAPGDERRHSQGHSQAMVARAIDRGAAQGRGALDVEPVRRGLDAGAQRAQGGDHRRDPVALLDAQLRSPPHPRNPLGLGGGHGQDGELVDHAGDQLPADLAGCTPSGGDQLLAAHVEIRDWLAALLALVAQLHSGAHGPEDIQQPGAGGVDADIPQQQVALGQQESANEEKGCRGKVARHEHIPRGQRLYGASKGVGDFSP